MKERTMDGDGWHSKGRATADDGPQWNFSPIGELDDRPNSVGGPGLPPILDEDDLVDVSPISGGRKLVLGLVAALVVALLATCGLLYWLDIRNYESTDDAFIDGNQSQVAAQISGRIDALLVSDNEHVAAGQVLLTLDPRDYEVRLEKSRSQADNAAAQAIEARAQLQVERASVEQASAQVRVAEADLLQAQQDLGRYKSIDPAAITRQTLDQSAATTKSAAARLDSARQAVLGAKAQLEEQEAKILAADAAASEAKAELRNAELQLSYTKITAPQAGRITKRSANLGNYVTAGQALLVIVPDQMWVTANFKETQLDLMHPGQPVEIAVDAFPGRTLSGHVDSMQTGTGAVFSALPAENATGNYVKVIQRVPVKIVFDGEAWRHLPLAPGLSVTPSVQVR
jgi:membrane fusion protein (multidrug efflux system)